MFKTGSGSASVCYICGIICVDNCEDLVRIRGMVMSLKEHRENRFLTTRELAELAHVSRATISKIESGRPGVLYPKTMKKIAEALNVAPAEIAEFQPGRRSSGPLGDDGRGE